MIKSAYILIYVLLLSACGTKFPTSNPRQYSLEIYQAIEEDNLVKYIELVHYGNGSIDTAMDMKRLKYFNNFLKNYGSGDTSNMLCQYIENGRLEYYICDINFYCDSLGETNDTIAILSMFIFAGKEVLEVNIGTKVQGLKLNNLDRFKLFFQNTDLLDPYQVNVEIKDFTKFANAREDTTIFYQYDTDTALTYSKFREELYNLLVNAKVDSVSGYKSRQLEHYAIKKISIETVLQGTLFGTNSVFIESYLGADEFDTFLSNTIVVRFNYDAEFYLDKAKNPKLDSLINRTYDCKGIYCN